MTLNEINTEIEKHFSYWVAQHNRNELNCNNARIVGEYICKACIIKKEGNTEGWNIISNKHLSLPKNLDKKKTTPQEDTLRFVDLIQVLWDLKCFSTSQVPKNQLDIIRNITNPSSHSANSISGVVSDDEMQTCHHNIAPLMKWYFSEILSQTIPSSIQNALNGTPDSQYLSDSDEKWREFLIACENFDRRYQYILVSPKKLSDNIQTVEAFAKIPWRLVLDFNPNSQTEETGLLYQFNKLKGSNYQKTFDITETKPSFEPDFNHYWFFANGIGSSVQPEIDFKSWSKRYTNYLSETLYSKFNEGSSGVVLK